MVRPLSNPDLPVHRAATPSAEAPGGYWARKQWSLRWLMGWRRTDREANTTTKRGPAENRAGLASLTALFQHGRILRPFRLVREDLRNLRGRYVSDWTVFNQLVFASAVYAFFTNILPGITFASDLDVLTGQSWGTIEVVFSTGLCGLIFAL